MAAVESELEPILDVVRDDLWQFETLESNFTIHF